MVSLLCVKTEKWLSDWARTAISCRRFAHRRTIFRYILFLIEAFVEAMEKFGFSGLNAIDIVNTGKVVREEIAMEDPERAAAL